MHTLSVTLRQHTPLLHFQHSQEGATLRASEVKPKLDRFLIDKLGGRDKIANEWFVGKGKHPALDYKMRIEGVGGRIEKMKMKSYPNKKGKWVTKAFPSVLSNMGGKDTEEELINFSMHEKLKLTITCRKENGLCEKIRENLPLFFARHNFGQRSSKGFGSFTISHIENKEVKMAPCFDGLLYMDYKVDNCSYDAQSTVMGIIESFWRILKNSIRADGSINVGGKQEITTIQQYIKRMKIQQMGRGRRDGDSRTPSPVLFKPVRYKGLYRIYILPDSAMLKRIDNESEDKRNIRIADKEDVSYIDEKFIGGYEDEPGSLGVNYETGEWRTSVGGQGPRAKKEVSVHFCYEDHE